MSEYAIGALVLLLTILLVTVAGQPEKAGQWLARAELAYDAARGDGQ